MEIISCPNQNWFCYVCGIFTDNQHRRNLTKRVLESYTDLFKVEYTPNLWYVPEVMCYYCYRNLVFRFKCQKDASIVHNKFHYKYVSPVIWLPRSEHSCDSCYFCISRKRAIGLHHYNRESIQHANVENVVPARRLDLNLDEDENADFTIEMDDSLLEMDESAFDSDEDVLKMQPPPPKYLQVDPDPQTSTSSQAIEEGVQPTRGSSFLTATPAVSVSNFELTPISDSGFRRPGT